MNEALQTWLRWAVLLIAIFGFGWTQAGRLASLEQWQKDADVDRGLMARRIQSLENEIIGLQKQVAVWEEIEREK